jgi:predicted DNA-binding protein with PD1-like motif
MSDLIRINAPGLFRFIIGPGKEIYSEVLNLFEEQKWSEAVILNAVGSLVKVESEFPVSETLPPICESVSVGGGPFEIASLSGTVRYADGKPFAHIHGSFAARSKEFWGGAVNPGCVSWRGIEIILMAR